MSNGANLKPAVVNDTLRSTAMPTDTNSPLVYVSDAPTNSSLSRPLVAGILSDFVPGGENDDATVRATENVKQHQSGHTIDPDELPSTFYARYPDKKQGRLPHLFMANGFWCVSARCAEVLSRFDLGPGGTRPIQAFQHDRTTPIEGQYAVLNFGAHKTALVAEASPGARLPMGWEGPMRALKLNHKDNDIAVSISALDGVDLWVDPHLDRALFLSAPLADALRKARVATPWGLKACRVVGNADEGAGR